MNHSHRPTYRSLDPPSGNGDSFVAVERDSQASLVPSHSTLPNRHSSQSSPHSSLRSSHGDSFVPVNSRSSHGDSFVPVHSGSSRGDSFLPINGYQHHSLSSYGDGVSPINWNQPPAHHPTIPGRRDFQESNWSPSPRYPRPSPGAASVVGFLPHGSANAHRYSSDRVAGSVAGSERTNPPHNFPRLPEPPMSLAPHKFDNVQLLLEDHLGAGSFGRVCKAKCDDVLLCAAKVIHSMLKVHDPEAKSPEGRFIAECEVLSSLRHPNVVQYLGTKVIDGSLVLLMELMDESLTHFLEQSQAPEPVPVPYHIQVNICHDISLALSFLHSIGIIHRDLSSNNVLMIGDRRAKVTDFGMSTLMHPDRAGGRYTSCPGTKVYMPPEALDGNDTSHYTATIDCFSFGVVAIQLLTRMFPSPGERYGGTIYDHAHPGGIRTLIPEVERRQNHIKMVHPNHPILPIARSCLYDNDTMRPLSRELCVRFEQLKCQDKYRDSQEWQKARSVRREGYSQTSRSARKDGDLQTALSVQREEELQTALSMQRALDRLTRENMEKDDEIMRLRASDGNGHGMPSDQTVVEDLMKMVKEKKELAERIEKRKISAIEELEEVKFQLRKEKEEHKNTREILKDALQEVPVFEPTTDESVRLSSSLPIQRSNSFTRRARTWSTSSTEKDLPTATVQNCSSMMLDLLGHSGRPCAGEGIMSLTADLKSLVEKDKTVSAIVTSHYTVKYTPITRGRHLLSVKVNGVETSSHEVFVDYSIDMLSGSPHRVMHSQNGVYAIAVAGSYLYTTDPGSAKYDVLDLSSGKVLDSVACKTKIKGIAVDTEGCVYFTSDHRLHKYSAHGGKVDVLGGDNPSIGERLLNNPGGLCVHNNLIHVCDTDNYRVVVYDLDLKYVREYGKGIAKYKSPKKNLSHLEEPLDIVFGESGKAFVLDTCKMGIVSFRNYICEGSLISVGQLLTPTSLCYRSGHLLITDWPGRCFGIYHIASRGFVRKIDLAGSPIGICADNDGFVYVAITLAESTNGSVVVY